MKPFGAAALALLLISAAWAQNVQQPARELARRIVERTGPGAVYLEFSAAAARFTREDAASAEKTLTTELGQRGVRLVARNSAAASVNVTVAENAQGYLWVAEVRQGTRDPDIVMVQAERTAEAVAPTSGAAAMAVRKTLLWTQEQPILDVARVEAGSAQHLIVLDPQHVTLYRMKDGRWEQEQVLGVIHARPWPRNSRGRLMLRRDRLFDAYLPGVVCASTNSTPISMTCREADDPWPLSEAQGGESGFFSPVRNFFTGTLVPGVRAQTTVAPFFAAATLPRPGYALWITTALDGSTHLLDGASDQQIRPGWGTAITAVRSSCGTGWQLLATGQGDYTTPDSVRLVEMADREPAAAGEAADFPGPVMELWDTSDPATAVAIVHNVRTTFYEAYALSVVCGQ